MKNVTLEVTPDLHGLGLPGKGYSEEFGAREIARLVSSRIKDFFVDEVLFGSPGRRRWDMPGPTPQGDEAVISVVKSGAS